MAGGMKKFCPSTSLQVELIVPCGRELGQSAIDVLDKLTLY